VSTGISGDHYGFGRVDHEVIGIMKELEKKVINNFKQLLSQRVALHRLIMFGSRARGDAEPDSDMDVLVVLSGSNNATVRRYVNDCAWEAGFDHGLVVSPVVVERQSWVNGPERYSLLAKAVEDEGITI
jgi:predicted nucleotidyltransferase